MVIANAKLTYWYTFTLDLAEPSSFCDNIGKWCNKILEMFVVY